MKRKQVRVGGLCCFSEVPKLGIFEVCNRSFPHPFQNVRVNGRTNPPVMQPEGSPWRLAPAMDLSPPPQPNLVVRIVALPEQQAAGLAGATMGG